MAKSILTPTQKILLGEISAYLPLTKRFYLTGGTALAEFYFQHRLSEDLDFFSEEEFDTTYITIFLSKNQRKIGFKKFDIEEKPNRFFYFLDFPGKEKIKVDFAFYPYPRIRADLGKKVNSLRIDSVFDIAANKVFTLFQHPRLRDYIDLYFIFQNTPDFNLETLVAYARNKFDFGVDKKTLAKHFLGVLDLNQVDFPKMLKPFSRKEMEDFFLNLAKSLEKEIFME
ncbi:nucleotidyl transferase AbiEii/AbiGii toxin family protein [Candidatus Shapirobacteria bacterium]|nr:nucleotidyl transferase AbiEii/AbiGii toxin family protein [Candidatus Shapirobacteria bacterium]